MPKDGDDGDSRGGFIIQDQRYHDAGLPTSMVPTVDRLQGENEALRAQVAQLEAERNASHDLLRAKLAHIEKLEAALRRAKDQASMGVDVTGCRYCRQVEVVVRAALADQEDALHDFRPGVYPGVDRLVNHLVEVHGVDRKVALQSNIGLAHQLAHSPDQEEARDRGEGQGGDA